MIGFPGGLLQAFAVALGVILGGSLVGAAAASLRGQYPLRTMMDLADELRLWGIVAALGGSFEPLREIERGLFGGEVRLLARQAAYILAAMAGGYVGWLLLRHLAAPRS